MKVHISNPIDIRSAPTGLCGTQISVTPEEIEGPNGIEISVKGFKGNPADDVPTQVFIEVYEGKLRVHVWDGETADPHTTEIRPNPYESIED